MSFFKSITLAFSMFSSIPMPRLEWNEKNMRYMMCAFPLVGVVIGLLCALWLYFSLHFLAVREHPLSLHIVSLGFVLIPVIVTGGIHIDGFMDTCDALGSHASTEKKLEILKDSHSGAFAVLGCVLYFLAYYILSFELCSRLHAAVLLVPVGLIFVLSRLLSAFAVATFPIAKNSGLVHTFASASYKKRTAFFCYACFFLISAFLVFRWNFLGIALVAVNLSLFCFYFVVAVRNFGGITGDTAGWFVQLCELVCIALLAFSY